MRHLNPKSSSCWNFRRGTKVTAPYYKNNWSFTKPSVKRRYIQVLQWLYDHPNATRAELHEGVFKSTYTSGSHCSLYAVLLWKDFIDYDKQFKYTITAKGMELLKKAYITDLARLYGTTAEKVEALTA